MPGEGHILALSEGSPRYKTDRLIGLFEALRARGVKYGKSYELPVLAALSVLEPDQSEAVSDILRADEFLSAQKGYGFWGLDKRTRLMHAAMLESDLLCRKNGVWSADFAEVSDATGQNAAAMASMTPVFFFCNKKKSWAAFLFVIALGATRNYIMVHFPSDILGGMLVGFIAGLVSYLIVNGLYDILCTKGKFGNRLENADIRNLFKKKDKAA